MFLDPFPTRILKTENNPCLPGAPLHQTTSGYNGYAHRTSPASTKTLRLLRQARPISSLFPLQGGVLLYPRASSLDRDHHKRSCNKIAKTREKVDVEERRLRESPADLFLVENVFETKVGHFSGIPGTHEYLWARTAFILALLEVNTLESVQTQLAESRDLLRLCRCDTKPTSSTMPGMMMRLGLDQECYDFVKWFETSGQDSDYDWGDMDSPFLDIKDADVFEPVDYLCQEFPDLGFISSVLLLKVKLLLDLKDLQNSTLAIGAKLPPELLHNVRSHLVRSPIIANNRRLLEREEHMEAIDSLTIQVSDLFLAIDEYNDYFWDCMLDPEPYLDECPTCCQAPGMSEVMIMFKYIYPSWQETPGAMDYIEELMYM
ncbi:hypothetical protein FQN50_008902 [Emmonsiellopsis sp. PD_5]|nr:hypothetical protein FQN50_008902 [Emmonsiellopsis sp. PD_5]